jgi:hypothetical protein
MNDSSQSKKTVLDIINFMSRKWDISKSRITLRLCRTTADIIKVDVQRLEAFDKSSVVSIADLING